MAAKPTVIPYVVQRLKMVLPAGKARPSPAISGPLASVGVNMAKFCKEFNARSKDYNDAMPLPVRISAYSDTSFSFTVHPPTTGYMLRRAALTEAGPDRPTHDLAGEPIHVKALYEIAMMKKKDVNVPQLHAQSLHAIFKSIVHQAITAGFIIDWRRESEIQHDIATLKDESDVESETTRIKTQVEQLISDPKTKSQLTPELQAKYNELFGPEAESSESDSEDSDFDLGLSSDSQEENEDGEEGDEEGAAADESDAEAEQARLAEEKAALALAASQPKVKRLSREAKAALEKEKKKAKLKAKKALEQDLAPGASAPAAATASPPAAAAAAATTSATEPNKK